MFAESQSESTIDVNALLRLARDQSAAARRELVEIIGDLFFDKNNVLSERERATMSDILRQLIHDVEISVRKHLAIRLSDEPDAPSELVYALANDNAEIAHPILMRSNVLKDPQLVEIILSFPPKTGPLLLEAEGGFDGSETSFRRGRTEAPARD